MRIDENSVHQGVEMSFDGILKIVETGASYAFGFDGKWCAEFSVTLLACTFEQHQRAAIGTCWVVKSAVKITRDYDGIFF